MVTPHGKIELMSTILAIETSSECASVALLHDGLLKSRDITGVTMHSQTVLPMVQMLLAEEDVALADCDAIAYGAGPGSFTGVRTACGIAQGLGFGARLPLLPLVTLLGLAQACREQCGADDVLAIIDARMGEVYWAQYRHDGSRWQTVTEPTLSTAAKVHAVGKPVACGNGLKAYAEDFRMHAFYLETWQELMPHAAQLAVLGAEALQRGEQVPAIQAEPLYLRNKVALTTRERQEKASAVAKGEA